jgi:hypothetical protein
LKQTEQKALFSEKAFSPAALASIADKPAKWIVFLAGGPRAVMRPTAAMSLARNAACWIWILRPG